MRQIFGGAVLVMAGIVAFIVAGSHRPEPEHKSLTLPPSSHVLGYLNVTGPSSGWSHTAYDLVRIAAWAVVIVGGLLIVTGLIRYWRAQG